MMDVKVWIIFQAILYFFGVA